MQTTNRHKLVGGLLATAVAGALLLGAASAHAAISVVVAAGSSLTLSASQAADMFAGVKTVWPSGVKVQVVDQAETATGRSFYVKCVKRPPTIVRAQWTRLTLSGQAMAPKSAGGDAEVKMAVSKLPGAIGYIDAASLDDTVKEVCRID